MKRDGKVLISGGLGFIGKRVASTLVELGHDVLLFDNLSPQVHGAVPHLCEDAIVRHPRVGVVRGDVRSAADWARILPGVRYVVHLAAETGTAQSMYEIARYAQTNVSGLCEFLNYLADSPQQIERVILASSRAVYGEGAYNCNDCGRVYPLPRSYEMLDAGQWNPTCPRCAARCSEPVPTAESARLSPSSIYGATKRAQEDLLRISSAALGLPAVILRLQNVYGEGQSVKNPYTGMLTIFAGQLRNGYRLSLFEDGQESRDFVHVDDVARAVTLALFREGVDGFTLNVGSGVATSLENVAQKLCTHFGDGADYAITGQFRMGDVRHAIADLTLVGQKLDYRPHISLDEGLDRLVQWVRAHPETPAEWASANEELVRRGLMPSIPVHAHRTSLAVRREGKQRVSGS